MSQPEISADETSCKYKTNGGNQRKAKAGQFRKECTDGKSAANRRKFNLLHKKEEQIAQKFKILLAEKPNLQEAAEKSRNNWQNEQKQKGIRRSKKPRKAGPFQK